MTALALLLALLAAASNAGANLADRKANQQAPPELELRLGLLLDLLRRPIWILGQVSGLVSFVLQAAALGNGALALVQPLLVLELPMTLFGARAAFGSPLGRREWWSAGVMTAGLAGLIALLDPRGAPHTRVPWFVWAIGLGAGGALVAGLFLLGRRAAGGRRAALLGLATGVSFGLGAVLMKGMTDAFSAGIVGVLTAWQTYLAVAVGIFGTWLMQAALHAGRLVAAQPGISLADPLVAIVWGLAVFGERFRGEWPLVGAVACGLALAAAGVLLSRSPQLSAHSGRAGAGADPYDEGHGGRAGRAVASAPGD